MATLDELLKRQQRQAQQPKSFISDLKPPGMAGETPAYAPEYPPPTFGKPPPQQRSGALGTVGREIAAVGAETLSGLACLANQVAGTSYTLPGAAERNINDPLGDFAKRMRAGQAENVERGRQAISEAEGVGGTLAALAQNPAAVGTMVAGQLPLLAGAVGAAGLAGRVGRARALAGGASPATA